MKNKKNIILIIFIIVIATLWLSGIIPKQIAKISATYQLNKEFSEWKLEYVDAEWSKHFGSYSITFVDKDGNKRGCLIGPKYLPIFLGQGVFSMREEYISEK